MQLRKILNEIKRFLEPALVNKLMFFKSIFVYAWIWGYSYFNVYILKLLVAEIENGNISGFRMIFIFFVGGAIVFLSINYIYRNSGWAEMYHHLLKQMHRKYMRRFVELDNNKIESIGTGKMITIINRGMTEWSNAILETISSVISFIITLIFALFTFKEAGYSYLFAFISTFILFSFILMKLNKNSLIKRSQRTEAELIYNNQIVRMIMSKFEIYQNSKIDKEIAFLDKYADEAQGFNKQLNTYLFWMNAGPKFLLTVLRIAVYFFIGFGIFYKTHKISDLVGIIALVAVMESFLYGFVNYFKGFTQCIAYIRKLWETFDNISLIQDKEGLVPFVFKKGDIVIRGLDFSYGDKMVFNDFSLEIKGGKRTALVGHSGSGKSTLAKLLIGYLRTEKGAISADSQDISQIDLPSYYENIGYLTQDPSIFDGSILENLIYGAKHDVTEEELDKAIRLAECSFIYDFKDGLETEIGERGIRLSGGQRQRLAIAKIFIKNPKIIVLDEPTSALDSFSEEKISEAFRNLFEGRTVIVIAHRLQTVKEADDIIVLEDGKVKERGKHSELVEKKGIYNKMLELQSGF